jgi:hypothetical protein
MDAGRRGFAGDFDSDEVFSEGSFPIMLGMFHAMNPSQIKNILWDVDGVLAERDIRTTRNATPG